MQNLDWLTDALGDFEDDYVRFPFLFFFLSFSFLWSFPSLIDYVFSVDH